MVKGPHIIEQSFAPVSLPSTTSSTPWRMPKAATLAALAPPKVVPAPRRHDRSVLAIVENHLHVLLDIVAKELASPTIDEVESASSTAIELHSKKLVSPLKGGGIGFSPRVAEPCYKPSPEANGVDSEAPREFTSWSENGDGIADAERFGLPLADGSVTETKESTKLESSQVADTAHPHNQLVKVRESKSDDEETPNSWAKIQQNFNRLDKYQAGRLSTEDCSEVIFDSLGKAPQNSVIASMIRDLNMLTQAHNGTEPMMDASGADAESGANDTSYYIGIEQYQWLMNTYEPGTVGETTDLSYLRLAFRKDIQLHFQEMNLKLAEKESEDSTHVKKRGVPGLLLDTAPALMILTNALVMGLQQDISPNSVVWEWLEMYFYTFFLLEFLIKWRLFGCMKLLFIGEDRYWNYFDLFCIITGTLDLMMTHLMKTVSLPINVTSIKILRLARLGRLVRLLRFKIFHELKMMVQGVVSGMRVLCWAIVLLLFCVFLLAIVCRSMLNDQPEFATVDRAMFSLFRCFTDGCSAYNGTPLHERLREDYGLLVMFVYILVFLFVTIGIFNLIMAIFIDNVATAHIQRKQHELGENAAKMEVRINEVIAKKFESVAVSARETRANIIMQREASSGGFGFLHSFTENGKEKDWERRKRESAIVIAEMDEDIVITKDIFNTWLDDREMLDLLEEVEVETSTKYELFDALDVDSGGELTVDELVSGLMKLRGPVSKNDIVATRLKVAYITELIEDICRNLGIELSCDGPSNDNQGGAQVLKATSCKV